MVGSIPAPEGAGTKLGIEFTPETMETTLAGPWPLVLAVPYGVRNGTLPEDLVAPGNGILAVTAVGSDVGIPATIEPGGAVMV